MLHVQQPDSSLYARHGELETALKRAARSKERGFAVGMFLVLAYFTLFLVLTVVGALTFALWFGLGDFAVLMGMLIVLLPSFWPRCPPCGARLSRIERTGGGSRPILLCCRACRIYADSGELDGD